MPPKKRSSNNAFMIFTFEWKAKNGKDLSLKQATQETGKIWANMSEEERAPYREKARHQKGASNSNVEKLTCTGVPISIVEKEKQELENKERQIKRDIENTVSNSVKTDELELHYYYFIMVNYFTKTLKGGVYVPAELSLNKFSLKDGNQNVYHTLINPDVDIYGHQYEAEYYSKATHNLPLPPNALGEKNLGHIYNAILNFIRDENTNDYPPLYTSRNCIHIVESVLEFLNADIGANNIDLKVYPIEYLFYIMKGATCEVGELEKPKSFYITDAFFERDFFEYEIGIGCQYHEEIDKSKYCTKSYVIRWGFLFCDYMCRDIAITLVPGHHCPNIRSEKSITSSAPSSCNDNMSCISMATTTSIATKPVAGSKIYYDDQKSIISEESKIYAEKDFPALGARRKVVDSRCKQSGLKRYSDNIDSDVVEDDVGAKQLNPWTNRSRIVPREPDTTHFTIDYTQDNSDFGDFGSVVSFGRGRGYLFNTSLNSSGASTSTGRGRGRFNRPKKDY